MSEVDHPLIREENRCARQVVEAAKHLLQTDPGRSRYPQWWDLRQSVLRYEDAQHKAQKEAGA